MAKSMKKKSSRCFSCFPCISARTPSSPHAEPHTPPLGHAPGPLPSNAPSVPSSSQLNPSPVADNNGLEGVSSGSLNTILQPPPSSFSSVPSPDAASSSNGVSSESSNTAAARHDDPHAMLPGTSSGVTVQDIINRIHDDIKSDNLDALIEDISYLLEAKKKEKESQKKPKQTTGYFWPTSSADFGQLKDLLEGVSSVKDINVNPSSQTKTIIRDILNGIGKAHWAVTPFLVVANVLQRLETKSKNEVECLALLTEMYKLAKHIRGIKERSELNKEMDDTIKEGTGLIVEGSLMCCCQIDRNKFSRFFLAPVESDELGIFGKKVDRFRMNLTNEMGLIHSDAIAKVNERVNEMNEGVNEVKGVVNEVKEEVKGLRTALPPKSTRKSREPPYPDHAALNKNIGLTKVGGAEIAQLIKYLELIQSGGLRGMCVLFILSQSGRHFAGLSPSASPSPSASTSALMEPMTEPRPDASSGEDCPSHPTTDTVHLGSESRFHEFM